MNTTEEENKNAFQDANEKIVENETEIKPVPDKEVEQATEIINLDENISDRG